MQGTEDIQPLLAQGVSAEATLQALSFGGGKDPADSPPPTIRYPQYVLPGNHTYNTQLPPPQEQAFLQWLQQNQVPFDAKAAVTDYDMRGFYQALQAQDPRATSAVDPNDQQLHYPDYWKTPYHETFSNESQWATPNAPKWNDQDQLIDEKGSIVYDDRVPKQPR